MRALAGIVRTRVGYAGGTNRNPTYHAPGDHTEVFRVAYDPSEVAFTDLLERVVRRHDPNRQTANTQYQNVVFAATESRRGAIDAFPRRREIGLGRVRDARRAPHAVLPGGGLPPEAQPPDAARLLDCLEDAGYDDAAVRESPAAATLNGLAAGHDLPEDDDLAQGASETGPYR